MVLKVDFKLVIVGRIFCVPFFFPVLSKVKKTKLPAVTLRAYYIFIVGLIGPNGLLKT